MATEAAVRAAIDALRARVNAARPEGSVDIPDRSILCIVPDLGTAFRTQLHQGKLGEIEPVATDAAADARLTARSDELVALLEGRSNVAAAFLLGRIKIDASPADMMLIRKLF